MAPKQNIDVMAELIKIGLEFLRKQAGIVLVLVALCLAMGWFILEQRREIVTQMGATTTELRTRLADMTIRMEACEEARARLVVQVEVLKARADALAEQVQALQWKRGVLKSN